MIDATPSLEAAKGLTGPGLLDYLVANGWAARPSRVDGIVILSKDVPGADRPAEFILPAEPGWEDEQRRVADALRTIAAVERRSLADIADEVRSIMAPAGLPTVRRWQASPRTARRSPRRSLALIFRRKIRGAAATRHGSSAARGMLANVTMVPAHRPYAVRMAS